ncbi:YSIRK-type signal peptide-containing protein, partial [Streptococcus mitis]|uniref:YSIRK-type signal peptide-containing protein n=1 Tax=Streptococcus mitis TaxID=28037 RepID=UPI0021B813A9
MKFGKHPGEKLTRFSIRKYHFGAASVAVASLLFFGANSVKAEEALVTRQAGVAASSSNPNSGESAPDKDSLEKSENSENSVPQASEVGGNSTIDATATSVAEVTKINDEGTSKPQLDKKSLPTEIAKPQVDKSELSLVVNQVSATISSLQSSNLAENVRTALEQVENAVANAKQVLEKTDASKADVEQALSSLQQAVASLEATKRSEVAPQPAQPEQQVEGNSGEGTSLPKKRGKKSPLVENSVADGKEGTAISEVANPMPTALEPVTPARSSRGRRGRTTEVQLESADGSTPEVGKETAPKELPTYKNGADTYKLADEMANIVTYLRKNGADAAKVAAIKANYDKLNETLGAHEDGVLSEEDFNKALANLKEARDVTEGFLNNQPSAQPEVLSLTRRSRAAGQDRASTTEYNAAKEYYYEDGTKGSSPYDKYTYLFHTFTESLVANNANHSPVRDIKRLVYEEVNEVDGGYLWNITYNAAHEDQHDGYAFFTIPRGQNIVNSSINIVKTSPDGTSEEITGSGDLNDRVARLFRGKEIDVRRNGNSDEESLEGLARGTAYAGYYTRRLETANGESQKSDDMFNKIADNTAKVYRFQVHGRDTYTISFKTTNTSKTTMDKLYYASGYRVQQWGRRILAEQWHGRHAYDKSDTDRFPLHVVGNGTFLIKQGKHYNTAYPQGAYGFGGYDFDYKPFNADGILGYDASGAYNSNFDMHQYTAPVGSNTPSSNTKATTAGQKFEFYDKEGNKLSASQIGMHGADKPGLVEYKVKRTFADKSSDFLNIKFAIQPKTPTLTENLSKARGQVKTLTVSNGTDGYPITLFREYQENGSTKTERVKTVNAGRNGNAVFNDVLIKSGKYYAQSIIPTSAYLDYQNNKHTDVKSEKSALVTVGGDGMAPTIKVGETGKSLAATPANNQVTLFVTPNSNGEVSLDVQIQDDELGDGMNAFSSAANGNAKYSITGAYNSGATTFTAKGGVTGGKTVNALLKVKLNGTTIPNGGLTVTLNAKDKADNWTNTATPSKTLTVKLLSAVPNEPAVREITGADVQNGAIKPEVKNQVLQNVKNANPDLAKAGVKFEYDTTAGNTDKIKVTYPDGQTRLLTPTKGKKPTAPSVVGPADGTVSITPQGDTDKVTFQYVPTGQTGPQQIIAKKDGNSWAIQGARPNGITVDSRSGKITITEPTVKDQSTVTATATFLNSDTSDRGEDTAKNPDRQAPTVMVKTGDGTVRTLTANAAENKFLVFRGATFNPTFIVNDNSGTTDNLMIKNVPNGVWFNQQGGRDVARTNLTNGSEITFSNQVVDTNAPLGTREAIVSVRDKNGNAAEYKFQYIIADVILKNSPASAATGSKLGDAHRFLATTLNGTTSNDDTYFPGNMTFAWGNKETSETPLPNTSQTITKQATAIFPANSRNGATTANGITVYAPERITKNVTFNVADNSKPQATLNGQSLGETATTPIFTVFRGANFNPTIKAWDNSGIIQNISVLSVLPAGVTATSYSGGKQTGKTGATEATKYSQTLFSGIVANTQALGEHEIELSVKGSDDNDVSTFRFKYRVVDMELKNVVNMQGAPAPVIALDNNKTVMVADGQNNIDAHNYLNVVDEATKADKGDSYLPQGMSFTFDTKVNRNGISSDPNDENKNPKPATKQGLYQGYVKANFTNASGEVTNTSSTTRTVFAPNEISKEIRFGIVPNAPSLEVESLYGKAESRPDITVSNVVLGGEGFGKVNPDATREVKLYSTKNPDVVLASKTVPRGVSTVTFTAADYAGTRPNGLEPNEQIYAVTDVSHSNQTIRSGTSASALVTARLDITENSTNRIIQADDQRLNDAEKTGIRIALRAANRNLNLSDENIEISDTGAITITTADKRRGWLQTNPNKKDGTTTTGFITRFADIRNDYKFENIEGLKVPGRDTDKGFAWSNDPSDNRVNSNRSLIYYYDATKGQSFNFNDVLKVLNLREGWTVNHTENPSFVATQGVNKGKAERGEDGFNKDAGNNFFKDGNYINVLDLVDKERLSGGQNVSNSANKLVQEGKGGGTDTNLQNVTIAAANGLPGFTLNNVVNGEQAIHKAQVYLRPKYVNATSLAERNGETKDTTTNVVNLYFVPIDPIKPVVERSDSNNLGTSADDAPRLTDTSITASSLVKVTDNYDRDDLGTGATSTSSTGSANPTTGTTLANEVRKRLNVWAKKGNQEIQVVANGRELTTATGETVLSSLIKTVEPGSYELIAKTADTSGNETEKQSLGFFKVGYNLDVRPVINFIQYEKLTDDDKRTLVRVNEGGQIEELPNGATVDVTFDTENVNSDRENKRATATITFANGATTTKEIQYKVYRSFPVVNKLYDFAGATKFNYYYDPDYYKNVGLTGGMNWFVKKETEENGQKVFKDVPPKANPNEHVMPREVNKSIAQGVGEYKYILGATYPTGRYTETATDELSKLRRSGEIVHTVFDVGANDTNKVTVSSGDTLTADQAKAAVMPINGSKDLPEGTTYEWVSGLTVTGRGGTEVDREVRVTLPATDPNGPFAATVRKPKTVKVKVKIEDVKPTVKIKIGDSVANLTTTAQDNRFVIFKGATFNPTFIVNDNSGTTASINIANLPNGRSVSKTEAMPNETNITVTDADAVTSDATIGSREASITVTDASGNTETYKFAYTVEDAIPKEETKTVPLGTKLGTDSHDYVKLAVSTEPDFRVYPGGMAFKWKKDNVEVTDGETALSEPGRVTGYKAVVKFRAPGFYTMNGGKTFVPESIERPITFLVQPTAPTVTAKDNGDVLITPTNQTNVDKVSVTFTKQDDSTEVTYTAKKNASGVWEFGSGAPLTVDPTTGVFRLKDRVVKDGSIVTAKALTTDGTGSVQSNPATETAGNGDAIYPTVTFTNNVETDAQGNRVVYITPTEETDLPVATLDDNTHKLISANFVGYDGQPTNLTTVGLNFANKVEENGDVQHEAPITVNIKGTLSRTNPSNRLWANGEIIAHTYADAKDAAENRLHDYPGNKLQSNQSGTRVIFKVKTQAAKYTPTADTLTRTDQQAKHTNDQVLSAVSGTNIARKEIVGNIPNESGAAVVKVTYNDGSTKNVNVPIKVKPASPVVTADEGTATVRVTPTGDVD